MARLKQIIEEGSYSTQGEMWKLDNGLIFEIYFGDEIDVNISSVSGDVSDQVFEKLTILEPYKNMQLIPLGCYFVRIDKNILKDFMNDVEKIDSSKLKQGKTY